uniref:Uncharacterized protein n=1 Tax=Glycine max TaxID=3847 RepID=A0A0R0KQH9_SOYBN
MGSDDVCKEVECGKGTCKPSKNSSFFFECECQPESFNDESGLKFLPRIIPNCTLDYSYSKAPAPVQQKATKPNESIFYACHWVDCGGGSCNKTSKFFGMGYSELGISMTNSSTSTPPALNDNIKNEGLY